MSRSEKSIKRHGRQPVVGLLLALLVATVSVPVGASNAQPLDSQPVQPQSVEDGATSADGCPPNPPGGFAPRSRDVPSHCEAHYDDFYELEERLGGLGLFDGRLEEAFGDRYGDSWIDRSGPQSVLAVGVAGATEDDAATLARLTGSYDRVVLVPVRYPRHELRRYKEELSRALRADRSLGYSNGIDPTLNKVVANVARPVAVSVPGVPPDAYEIRVGYAFVNWHGTRADYPPYEGGLAPVSDMPCTSAFTTFSAATGQHYGTTAGHCGKAGRPIRIGDNSSGEDCTGSPGCIGSNTFWASDPHDSDAARYWIPDRAATPRINTGRDGHRRVKGKLTNADLKLDTPLCFQGVKAGANNCGKITADGIDVDLAEGNPGTGGVFKTPAAVGLRAPAMLSDPARPLGPASAHHRLPLLAIS